MGIVVRQSPEGRMEKTSGSNDGPNSFQQHGAPTRTARAGSRCAHQSAGTFDDTAAETRVPPSLDGARAPRASPWSRGGLARGSPVPHGIDWHGFVHVADVTYILTFGSLDSRRGSPPDLRSRVNLASMRACPGCPRHSSAALSAPAGVGGRVPASVRPGPGRGTRAFPFGFLRASPVPNRC